MNTYEQRSDGYIVLKSDIDTEKIQPILKRKNDKFNEPYIFFSPKIRKDNFPSLIDNKNDWLLFSHYVPTMYYEYVAFNEGYTRFNKTAKFKQVQINKNSSFPYSFPDVPISDIPKDALIQLRNFLDKKRDPESDIFEKTTFCKTIYDAVIDEIGLGKMRFKRHINILQEQEQLYEKLGEDAEIYKDIIKKMKNIQSEIRSIQSEQLSGPDGFSFPRNIRKQNYDYSILYERKKKIELNHGIDFRNPYN